jgi:hypothetical protein
LRDTIALVATYKVIQDIEAEDKLLGPLTLRQFIYAVIVVVLGFISFKLGLALWYLSLPFLPFMILFAILAAPFGHDQPSEIWLLAKIRFSLKPRRRIWDQSGLKQLVTITVPKKAEKAYSDGLSQIEVRSRLRALADTIDSRGWAVKNVSVNLYNQPALAAAGAGSDRLVDLSSLPREVPNTDITASDDIMDAKNNPLAQQLDQMMVASAQSHRQQVVDRMKQPAQSTKQPPTNDYWFMHQLDADELPRLGYTTFGSQTVTPGATPKSKTVSSKPSPDEEAILQQIHANKDAFPKAAYGHMKVIDPLGQRKSTPGSGAARHSGQATGPDDTGNGQASSNDGNGAANIPASDPAAAVTRPSEPAILELASNDDLNVATLAREANRQRKNPPTDEVVISLH